MSLQTAVERYEAFENVVIVICNMIQVRKDSKSILDPQFSHDLCLFKAIMLRNGRDSCNVPFIDILKGVTYN